MQVLIYVYFAKISEEHVHFILDTVCNIHNSLLDGCELDWAEGISSSAKVII